MPLPIKKPVDDPVNHPSHYTFGSIEVIHVIDDWQLDYYRGTILKYLARAGRKDPDKELEDLKKAQFYLNHYIELKEQS